MDAAALNVLEQDGLSAAHWPIPACTVGRKSKKLDITIICTNAQDVAGEKKLTLEIRSRCFLIYQRFKIAFSH